MDYNKLIEKAVFELAMTEYFRVNLKYYDQRFGKTYHPEALLIEEQMNFEPVIAGTILKDDVIIQISHDFEREPSVKVKTKTESRKNIFGTLIAEKITETTPVIVYSKMRHYAKISSPYFSTATFEINKDVFKKIRDYILNNWEDIKSERWIIDEMNKDEELKRIKKLFKYE